MKNKNELFITEISESDFRKLDLEAYEQEEVASIVLGKERRCFIWKRISLNNVLDDVIMANNDAHYSEPKYDSVYFAIHNENGLSSDPTNYYFDKGMNAFTGPRTYQLGIGLEHLYSTRDYFEAKNRPWRVKKSETKAIYCVHLDRKAEK